MHEKLTQIPQKSLSWLLSLSSHIHNSMKNGAKFLMDLHLIPTQVCSLMSSEYQHNPALLQQPLPYCDVCFLFFSITFATLMCQI